MDAVDVENKAGLDKRSWVRLVNALSGVKSANLIGSISHQGQPNLAIISSVFHLGANPPLMGFVLRPHSPSSPRHTFENIRETSFFTINHVQSQIYERAHQTSARYNKGVSEFEECDLTPEWKSNFKAPFVEESKIQVGLKLLEILEIKQNNTHLVIGEVVQVFLEKNLLRSDGSIDIKKADSVAVTGLDEYHRILPLARLSYAKPDKPIERI